jgi:hypothetical protein
MTYRLTGKLLEESIKESYLVERELTLIMREMDSSKPVRMPESKMNTNTSRVNNLINRG